MKLTLTSLCCLFTCLFVGETARRSDVQIPEGSSRHAIVKRQADFLLNCPNETMKVEINQTVILPCSTSNQMKGSLMRVEWVVNGTTTICWYRYNQPLTVDENYRNRTFFTEEKLLSGNYSLQLTVKSSDSGTYTCSVRIGKKSQSCSFSLTVHPLGTVRPTVGKRIEGTSGILSIASGPVVVVIVIAMVITVITIKRQTQREGSRERDENQDNSDGGNNPETVALTCVQTEGVNGDFEGAGAHEEGSNHDPDSTTETQSVRNRNGHKPNSDHQSDTDRESQGSQNGQNTNTDHQNDKMKPN